ncbi:hypothetical protein LOZ57_003817 [Ophidiomyces ophidiicola]|uniref:uncharacterized protein n=1 Tax=Ophidiomyces ophidiicola TaxID=1387563 RepID=UPI0020C3D249|nr:uncharacterized protein LOZ57_003817 [Ophidiomyces ophidiicola]KAI1946066.1 hypothetical protein LOZ57_003817 [Ophidiomyces ophidiicola]KAI2057456.1 hypothetical protein LOZ43_003071 [Ophidiomyces ophidiicola]
MEAATPKCRLVHHAKDQCAHILANCVDHDVGLLSYLQLYYCKLPQAKPVAFIILALWLSLLFSTVGIAASDFLCVNLSTISSILGMSESLTGVTFLAFGNGSPDVFSTFAAMRSNSGSLAIGELIGAAGFITAVVTGSMALVRPFKVARRSFLRDIAFFTCAASVSLVFIADGKLYFWECALMIGFYLFYVMTVVTWHWYLGRKRRQRERDLMARAHFHIPQNQELDIHDVPEDEDAPVANVQRPLVFGASDEDFDALERADIPTWKVEDAEDDETRDRYLAELQGNMRVSGPHVSQRGNAMGPIRPSLVGALEFRSVLSSLERSRSFHSGRIHLRSYSNDHHPGLVVDTSSLMMPPIHGRARAISANPPTQRHFHKTSSHNVTSEIGAPSVFPSQSIPPTIKFAASRHLVASPTSSGYPSRSQSPVPGEQSGTPSFLAPPGAFHNPNYRAEGGEMHSAEASLLTSPISPGTVQQELPSPGANSSASPTAPFPAYHDEDDFSLRSEIPSFILPPPSISAGSLPPSSQHACLHHDERLLSWWPYRYLPPPSVLMSTLFPTLACWNEKSLWEKALGITAAPSVFFLTITLPVIEPPEPEESAPSLVSPLLTSNEHSRQTTIHVEPGTSDENTHLLSAGYNIAQDSRAKSSIPPMSSISRCRRDSEAPVSHIEVENSSSVPKPWNPWLLAIQLLTAPFFIALTAWINLDSNMNAGNLLIPALISLCISTILLTLLLFTSNHTTKQLPSRARPFLAALGFVVSIAWISTLATEVVNLLKALGIILSISDPLLGLTIFAVGNSLGDLVANVTVARLGYPVMALSACFGGPMLNILIGIGVGGLYMTVNPTKKQTSMSVSPTSLDTIVSRAISTAHHPYPIKVSTSLAISGGTLLATLIGLLIIVPLNGWRMDRKIGLGLVALWCISTVCNVIIEVLS